MTLFSPPQHVSSLEAVLPASLLRSTSTAAGATDLIGEISQKRQSTVLRGCGVCFCLVSPQCSIIFHLTLGVKCGLEYQTSSQLILCPWLCWRRDSVCLLPVDSCVLLHLSAPNLFTLTPSQAWHESRATLRESNTQYQTDWLRGSCAFILRVCVCSPFSFTFSFPLMCFPLSSSSFFLLVLCLSVCLTYITTVYPSPRILPFMFLNGFAEDFQKYWNILTLYFVLFLT